MTTIYIILAAFMLILAVFDLFVGVSNDAVNFLNSAIGARVAKFKTVLVIASAGIFVGALMSAGMMDVARHGVLHPSNISFHDVMMIFLGVMVTDVIILDMFNTLGLPTSTTVSLIFNLLGGVFVLALYRVSQDPSLAIGDILNSDKALTMIVAIFVSVGISLVFGYVVQYIARVIFTFNYKKNLRYTIAVFGGVAFTFLSYFIIIKGFGSSPILSDGVRGWIASNQSLLLGCIFVVATLASQLLHLLHVNVFKVVVLVGTFALAMAFSSNDLVNFIGVPLAGLDSYLDFVQSGAADPNAYMMTSLESSAKAPFLYLLAAGVIMIIAMGTSKKAHNVIKTSVDLSRQDEADSMFGSSRAARSILHFFQTTSSTFSVIVPKRMSRWVDSRFNTAEGSLPEGAAFDVVRAAVNLVLASALIIVGTIYKLPLSTTYVTFMVAMGTSLADRAWTRESAVYRITGVVSVIGGWLITAAAAFICCAVITAILLYGGFVAAVCSMVLVGVVLWRSHKMYSDRVVADKKEKSEFELMMRCSTPSLVSELLCRNVAKNQSDVTDFVLEQYKVIIDSINNETVRPLRHVRRALADQQMEQKKLRRKQYLALRRIPGDMLLERNTWFHLGSNSAQQYIYCLKRILEPSFEHVDNHFNPMPEEYIEEFAPVREAFERLFSETSAAIRDGNYYDYDRIFGEADDMKAVLSDMRHRHIDRMHSHSAASDYRISLLYLNILQETQELFSIMRHQLRATRKFVE